MGVDLAAEEQFGPYLVYERLGVGGMATVHRALERGIEGFERIVALKRLLPHLAEDASFIKSFVREAKLASLLNHVNIVQIFELGRVGTQYFISMEYIDGRDIRRILRHARKVTGPPPIHVTVGLLLQLCDALDYAHSKVDEHGQPLGLVHRDVSPSNVLVTDVGHVKVIDFGIAKAQSSQLRTQTGRVKGKLAYMAPEAISGKELDSRSDLFAVGVIAHELLTARPLFASKNEYQTLLKVQRGDIMPPSTFNQATPQELDAIVLKALARDPDERYRDAAELRDALLELRRLYGLQTSHRDIAQWLTWAFSVEAPSGFGGVTGTPDPDPHSAVEIAWGGGEQEGSGEPVVLDDVPDVSEKIAFSEQSLGASPRIDSVDDLFERPPSKPPASHRAASIGRATPLPRAPSRATPVPRATSKQMPVVDDLAGRTTPTGMPAMRESGFDLESAHTTPTGMPAMRDGRRPSTPGERPSGPISARPAISLTDLSGDDDGVDTLPGDVEAPAPEQPARAASPAAVAPQLPDARIARTKPGHVPARAATPLPVAAPVPQDAANEAAPTRMKRPSDLTIGAAMIERESSGRRAWVLVAALAAAGAAATAITLYATRGQDAVAKLDAPAAATRAEPPKAVGTVKFDTQPQDAEISIAGQVAHTGSPWSIQLEPGMHQIQIHRAGYKAWLTSIELSANETQTLRVVLEPLSTQAVISEATLILSSTPSGLEAVLDGKVLPVKTPIKMPISPGPHTIVLRQDGVDVWRHELVAQPSVDYEFSPSMSEDKRREREERAKRTTRADRPDRSDRVRTQSNDERTAAVPPPPPAPAIVDKPATPDRAPPAPPPPTTTTTTTTPPAARPTAPAPPPVRPTPPPVAITTPAKPPVAPPRPTGPVLVPPSAVKRVSGETPTVGSSNRGNVPNVVAAKVCIDTSGNVDSVTMITKLERIASLDLTRGLRTWRYAPYRQGGVAVPACFVVNFRVK